MFSGKVATLRIKPGIALLLSLIENWCRTCFSQCCKIRCHVKIVNFVLRLEIKWGSMSIKCMQSATPGENTMSVFTFIWLLAGLVSKFLQIAKSLWTMWFWYLSGRLTICIFHSVKYAVLRNPFKIPQMPFHFAFQLHIAVPNRRETVTEIALYPC